MSFRGWDQYYNKEENKHKHMMTYIRALTRSIIEVLTKDVYAYIPLIIGGVIWLVNVAISMVYIITLENPLIIKTTEYGIILNTGTHADIFFILGLLLLFFIINSVIAFNLYGREHILTYSILFTSVWIQIVGLVLLIQILFLNT